METYHRLLELNPSDVDSHFNLGKCCLALGLYQQGVYVFDIVLDSNPLDIDAYFEKGRCLMF
jgi:tetratricopeptide (TPR) repeat protein